MPTKGPLFYVSSVMGLFPHEASRNRQPLTRYFLTLATYVVVCVCYRTYYVLYSGNPWLKRQFNGLTFILTSILESVCILLHCFVCVAKEGEFRKMLLDLRKGSYPTVKQFSTVLTVVSITWLMIYQIGYGIAVKPTLHITMNFIIILIDQIMIHFIGLQFCCFLLIVREQYDQLTDYLLFGYETDFYAKGLVDYCSTLLEHHSALNKAAHLINSLYQKQMASLVANLTLYFITWVYYVFTDVWDNNPIAATFRAAYSVWILFFIFTICHSCQLTKTSAEKFNSELFRLMRENKELCKNEKLQLYVTMKQTVNFTACGFFTLGYPLVTSIIAAATTYLVILVQFSMPPSKSS